MAAADALLALASSVPLVVLGAAVLTLRGRPGEATFFGFFAVLWGAQVAATNVGRVVGELSVHAAGLLASFALQPPMYLFLAHFAARHHGGRRLGWLTLAFGGVAAAATAILLLRPELVVASVESADGRIVRTTWGPAMVPFFAVPFFGVFWMALVVLERRYRAAPPGSARHRSRGVLLALALFSSYATARNLLVFSGGAGSVRIQGAVGAAGLAAVFAAGALVLLYLVARSVLRPPPPEERDRVLIAAFLVPAAVAVLESGGAIGGASVNSVGFWRILTVAVLVHGLARYQLFDLDVKLRRFAGPGIAALSLGFGALFGLVAGLGAGDATRAMPPIVVGAAVAGAAWSLRGPIGSRLFPGVVESPDYLYQRKLEVYRAALERTVAEGASSTGDELRRLRKSLGISDREHNVMEFMVRDRMGSRAAPEPEAPPRVEPGALLLGRYRVERLLGEGAHGRAYLAHDETIDRAVVVKAVGTSLYGGRAAKLLLREARLAGGLRHANIIGVHDVAEGPHEAVIVMEYADGGSLFGLLSRRGRLHIEEAAGILDQVLSGLAAAHAKGIVHRDVKPENLLLMRDGTVKIADFGIARETRPDATGLTGGAVGTLLYMSPEQVRGLAVDARSDLYAAAVVFHQLLAGRFYLKIAGRDDFQVRQLILEGEPWLSVKDAPGWVEPFLRKSLAKDPEERYADSVAMRAALRGSVPLA
ncbi:MAG: serine/threonine-protein kinase [Methanobacteriota archaeon]